MAPFSSRAVHSLSTLVVVDDVLVLVFFRYLFSYRVPSGVPALPGAFELSWENCGAQNTENIDRSKPGKA